MVYSILILDICLIWILAAAFIALAVGDIRSRRRQTPRPITQPVPPPSTRKLDP